MKLLVFGLGYTSQAFVRLAAPRMDEIVATRRLPPLACVEEGRADAKSHPTSFPLVGKVVPSEAEGRMGVAPPILASVQVAPPPPRPDAARPLGPPHKGEGRRTREAATTLRAFPGEESALAADIAEADAILVSIPPDPSLPAPHDPVLAAFAEAIRTAPHLRWLGYLSTIGVYGDHAGAWVDETTPVAPSSRRTRARVEAERAWLALAAEAGVPAHVFRIAGIYGPGRSAFDKLADGTARRIVKPGQVFNRIHVDDIARILEASLARPRPGAIYNVADGEPAPPEDVVAEAARLAGLPVPPAIPFDEADMSPMALSFWGEVKRVSNRKVREELGVALASPTYREGLRAILRAEGAVRPAGDSPSA